MKAMIHMRCRTMKLPPGLVLVLLLLLPAGLQAQDHTARRSVERTFAVSRESTLEIQNKYGQIQVVTWDRDSAQIRVDMKLTESSASKLRKLKDDVSIQFSKTGSYLLARSRFESEKGRIARELKSIGTTITGSNKHVEINYTLYIPEYLDIVLNNKFGDIYMDNLTGNVEVILSNGVINADHLEGSTSISLSFGNGLIRSMGSGSMNLNYSDMTLGDASQLDLVSKSSTLNADSVNVLKINSRRDKLNFQQVEYLYGNSDFTQVRIYDFLKESDVYMKYGKLTMDRVVPGFSKIYVESEYTDISLAFEKESAFAVNILHHDKAILQLPYPEMQTRETTGEDDYFRIMGTLGDGNPSSSVTIDALQKCYVKLSIK